MENTPFIQKLKSRKFILGIIVFIVTLVICLLLFEKWDWLKALLRGS